MDHAKYKQMSGRAGRTGFDSEGNSIMICRPEYREHVSDLMKPFSCQLKSALTGPRLMKALLEIIATNSVSNLEHIRLFLESTLNFTLCEQQLCSLCQESYSQNKILFAIEKDPSLRAVLFPKHILEFYEAKQGFQLEQFRSLETSSDC
jgi:replicative superfamily II helicase